MVQESDRLRSSLRLVTLKSLRAPMRSDAGPPRVGIVADGEQRMLGIEALGLDITFPRIGGCPSTAVTNHGGAIATGDSVQLLFWGSVWETSSLSLFNSLTAGVQSILAGPYMSGLRQYGIKRCPFGGALVVTAPNPPLAPSTFTDDTIHSVVQSLIDGGTFPEPDEPGGRNLYFVIMPPNTQYSPPPGLPPARGAHSSFSSGTAIDPDNVWVAWIGNNTLSQMTSTFCHELAEMCTDPESDAWRIDGAKPGCDEIADICNLQDGPLNGVTVESYWSIFDGACLIPTAWSVRRTLAGAGKKLDGKGLRSLQNPIGSLNQFIANL